MTHNAILTCALTGVLTNPQPYPVPVTPAQMAAQARDAFNACNAGSLNYQKIKAYGEWAWPPMVFDNPVVKVQQLLDVIRETQTQPEFECFDVGIVRSVLPRYALDGAHWQTTLIGRAEVWPVQRKTADLGGNLRTGLEDTFYLPDGSRAAGNGVLIEALAACARRAGRGVASPAEARARLGLHAGAPA